MEILLISFVQANKAVMEIFRAEYPLLRLAVEGKLILGNSAYQGYEVNGLLVSPEPPVSILVESKTNLKLQDGERVKGTAELLKKQCRDPRLQLSEEDVRIIEKSSTFIKILVSTVVSEQVLLGIRRDYPDIWVLSDSGKPLTVVHEGKGPSISSDRSAVSKNPGEKVEEPINETRASQTDQQGLHIQLWQWIESLLHQTGIGRAEG
jgi:hypothetical protein